MLQNSHAAGSTAPDTAPAFAVSMLQSALDYWGNVNTLALEKQSAWVPTLFGGAARFDQGTGAYRVSSEALGRDLEEDLSISPKGAKDFGVYDLGDPRAGARTPIDLVIEYGSERDAAGAANWLCERLGVDRQTLDWRAAAPRRADQINGEFEEIDSGTITQDSVAIVFARRSKDRFRFCHHTGTWYEWTSAFWQIDETKRAFQCIRELGREYSEGAKPAEIKEVRKTVFASPVRQAREQFGI